MDKLLDAFRKILIPVDFSEESKRALGTCSQMFADQHDKEFHFVHVLSSPSEYLGLDSTPHHKIEEDLKGFVSEYLAHKKPPEHLTVLSGHPATQICEYADKEKCDLIVMSTHGRTGLSHMLIGSVAENVVRHAGCPVLVLRRTKSP